MENRKKGIVFLLISISFILVLGLEFVPLIILGNQNISMQSSPMDWIMHWILTCILWSGVTFLICKLVDKKLSFKLLSFKDKPTKTAIILSIAIVLILTFMFFLDWDNTLKIWAEFTNYHNTYGSIGILVFLFQLVYYAFEVMIIVAIIAFAQKGFDLLFQKSNIPVGGIILGLTWGLGHIITKEFATGIFSILPSIFFGVIYILCKRNLKYAYPLIFLAFVL